MVINEIFLRAFQIAKAIEKLIFIFCLWFCNRH
jgi:hypothetical protein